MTNFSKRKSLVFFAVMLMAIGLSAEFSESFKRFLKSNAEMISMLAHPSNDYVRSYIDDYDNLVIINRCSFTDDTQVLKIYISSDLDSFDVIRDDDFFPAFAATEIMSDLLLEVVESIEEEISESEDANRLAKQIIEKADEMDGQQLTHAILMLKYIDYYL